MPEVFVKLYNQDVTRSAKLKTLQQRKSKEVETFINTMQKQVKLCDGTKKLLEQNGHNSIHKRVGQILDTRQLHIKGIKNKMSLEQSVKDP